MNGRTDLATLLGRAARELTVLGQEAAALDQLMGGVLTDADDLRPILAREGQRIDLLRQRVEDMARFLTRLAEDVPCGITVRPDRALQVMHLKDLASRLAAPDRAAAEPAEAGNVQLF